MTAGRFMGSVHWPLVALCATASVARADWPNFRGPGRDGISPETGFRVNWSGPIPVLWERTVGSAFSSFAVVGDRVYTCGTQDRKQVVYCLDGASGDIIWQKDIEEEFKNEFGDGTRATPAVDEGRVYILGALGTLLCLDAGKGEEIWRTKFHHKPQWAYSGSVLIEKDLAIVGAGESDGALVALDKRTGQRRWKCGADPVGYATPYPFTFEGTRYVVGFLGNSFLIAEAATGREVLRRAWETAWKVNASSPIYHDGHLWIGSGYETGCALFKLARAGDKLTADAVWQSKVLMNKFQSCILYKGTLYTSDQEALKCVEFMTGKEHWRVHRVKHGTLLLADDHLILLKEDGELQIAPVSTDGFHPTTTAKVLSGRCWTVPVLDNGRLYARNLEKVVCLNLRG